MFDSKVFEIIKNLKPSARNELELTEAIEWYVKSGLCSFDKIKGFWSDAGTFESLHKASSLVRQKEKDPSKIQDPSIENLYEMLKQQSEILKSLVNK